MDSSRVARPIPGLNGSPESEAAPWRCRAYNSRGSEGPRRVSGGRLYEEAQPRGIAAGRSVLAWGPTAKETEV